jgi:hypothetical protein
MITQRFRPVVWVAGVAFAATALYMVSLRVATERGRLETIDRKIASTRRDIRQLQTEFGTRASLRQLERWNGDVLALSSPGANQFLPGESALAKVDGLKLPTNGFAPPPVMVAEADEAPAVESAPVAQAVVAQATPAPVVAPVVAAKPVAKPQVAKPVPIARREIEPHPVVRSAPTRAERIAMLDETLVNREHLMDRHTLGDLAKQAKTEAKSKGKNSQ